MTGSRQFPKFPIIFSVISEHFKNSNFLTYMYMLFLRVVLDNRDRGRGSGTFSVRTVVRTMLYRNIKIISNCQHLMCSHYTDSFDFIQFFILYTYFANFANGTKLEWKSDQQISLSFYHNLFLHFSIHRKQKKIWQIHYMSIGYVTIN